MLSFRFNFHPPCFASFVFFSFYVFSFRVVFFFFFLSSSLVPSISISFLASLLCFDPRRLISVRVFSFENVRLSCTMYFLCASTPQGLLQRTAYSVRRGSSRGSGEKKKNSYTLLGKYGPRLLQGSNPQSYITHILVTACRGLECQQLH